MSAQDFLRKQSANPKAQQAARNGNWIEAGAIYLLELIDVNVFEGQSSSSQAVFEFKVLEMTPTGTEEEYKARGKRPNAVGTTGSVRFDLTEEWLCGKFFELLGHLSHSTIEELLENVSGETKAYEELVNFGKKVSPLAGLRIKDEASFGESKKKKTPITQHKWFPLPAPEGHPMAAAINAA